MAVSSYGASTQSSGVVRILKDLDQEIAGRHVLIVEDIIDSGLTLNYLMKSLSVRKPSSLEVASLLVKSGVQRADLTSSTRGSRSGRSSSSVTASTTPASTATSRTSASSKTTSEPRGLSWICGGSSARRSKRRTPFRPQAPHHPHTRHGEHGDDDDAITGNASASAVTPFQPSRPRTPRG
jgi:hypothetical protein